jgi:uncharacterized protein YjbI with pentapeptide repeats
MKSLKTMTSDIRNKIRQYSKNVIDISDLIIGYSLKGENLSHCVIKNIQRIDEDLTGVDFTHTKIGNSEGKICHFIRCKINNSNLDSAIFISPTWVRSCEVRNSNFRNADLAKVDYRNSDFRNTTFCDTIMRIGTGEGIGCKFDANLFEALTKGWNVDVQVTSKNEEKHLG